MIRKILTIIENSRSFLVVGHGSPDGDAIGSTLALAHALKEMGKEVVAYNQDPLPNNFRFLPGAEMMTGELPAGKRFDAGFVLDAGELKRAGKDVPGACGLLVNVDHHPFSENFGAAYLVDTSASATGIMIYRILKEAGHPISLPVATCIYTAITADTGSFRYSNANPEAFRVAGELVGLGVDPWAVAGVLYESQERQRLELLALALSTLEVSRSGLWASVSVTTDMYERTGSCAELTDGFVNYPRSIRGVEVALFFRQLEADSFKVGFRSKGQIDVGALSRSLGGGGHHNAAGAIVKGSLDEVRRQVGETLDALLAGEARGS